MYGRLARSYICTWRQADTQTTVTPRSGRRLSHTASVPFPNRRDNASLHKSAGTTNPPIVRNINISLRLPLNNTNSSTNTSHSSNNLSLSKIHQEIKQKCLEEGLHAAFMEVYGYHRMGISLNTVTYNILFSTALTNNDRAKVVEVLEFYKRYNIPYNKNTYTLNLRWMGQTGSLEEVENMWQRLLSNPENVTSEAIGTMLTIVRKRGLGIPKLQEVLQIAKQHNVKYDGIIYRELLIMWSKHFTNVNEFVKYYNDYMSAVSRGDVKDLPTIWVNIIYGFVLLQPRM